MGDAGLRYESIETKMITKTSLSLCIVRYRGQTVLIYNFYFVYFLFQLVAHCPKHNLSIFGISNGIRFTFVGDFDAVCYCITASSHRKNARFFTFHNLSDNYANYI